MKYLDVSADFSIKPKRVLMRTDEEHPSPGEFKALPFEPETVYRTHVWLFPQPASPSHGR